MIRKEACSFYRTISGVRLCWELEEPKGRKGPASGKGAGQARFGVQGYLAHKKTPPQEPTVGLCLGPVVVLWGGSFLMGEEPL